MLALDWQLIAMKMDRSITGSRQNILHHQILSIGVQSKNPDISGAIFTLSLSILILNSQCVPWAPEISGCFNTLPLYEPHILLYILPWGQKLQAIFDGKNYELFKIVFTIPEILEIVPGPGARIFSEIWKKNYDLSNF